MYKKFFQIMIVATSGFFITEVVPKTLNAKCPPPTPEWKASVKNETAMTLSCQAIDYSHFHTYGSKAPCVHTSGKVGPGNTISFFLPLSNCPLDENCNKAVNLDVNNIGINCFGPENKCYQLIGNVKSGSTIKTNCPNKG